MKRIVAGCLMVGMVAAMAAPVLAMEGKGPSTALTSKKADVRPGNASPTKGNVTVTTSKKVAHGEAPADRSLLNAAPGAQSPAPDGKAKVGC